MVTTRAFASSREHWLGQPKTLKPSGRNSFMSPCQHAGFSALPPWSTEKQWTSPNVGSLAVSSGKVRDLFAEKSEKLGVFHSLLVGALCMDRLEGNLWHPLLSCLTRGWGHPGINRNLGSPSTFSSLYTQGYWMQGLWGQIAWGWDLTIQSNLPSIRWNNFSHHLSHGHLRKGK